MLEKILFKLFQNYELILVLLIFLLIVGITIFILTRKLKINKTNIHIYGLLLGISNKEIWLISLITIKSILVVYSCWSYNKDILINLVMLAILAVLYIISCSSIKKGIFELLSTTAQMVAIFLINVLQEYLVDVSNNSYILMVKILLALFITLYAMIFFIKNIEDVISTNYKMRRAKNEREES